MESFHLGFCRAVCPGPPPALVSIVLPFLHYSRPCAAPRSFSVLGVLLVFCSLGHDGRVQPLRGHLARALLRLLVFAMERVHIPVRWLPIVLPSRQVSASHRECPPHFTRFSSASATSSTSPQPRLLHSGWEGVGEKSQGPAASLVCSQCGTRGLPSSAAGLGFPFGAGSAVGYAPLLLWLLLAKRGT